LKNNQTENGNKLVLKSRRNTIGSRR
jgi:hypothetical protein